MIDARELRSGNLFYPIERKDGIDIPQEVPFVVSGIMFFQVTGFRLGESVSQTSHHDFGFKSISPIPITEEWLLKMGFIEDSVQYEDQEDFYFFKKDVFYIDGNSLQPYDAGFPIANYKIEHVHQLQNLYFALTGEELEFKTVTA